MPSKPAQSQISRRAEILQTNHPGPIAPHSHVLCCRVKVVIARWIYYQPSPISAGDLPKRVGSAVEGEIGPVVLCATTENTPVALTDIHVVEHRDRQAIAAIFPGLATIETHVHTAIVQVVHEARVSRRHNETVMIGVSIIRLAARSVPFCHLAPRLSAILCQMKIHATTKHVAIISRMHGDGIAIRHLLLILEMRTRHILPAGSAVC